MSVFHPLYDSAHALFYNLLDNTVLNNYHVLSDERPFASVVSEEDCASKNRTRELADPAAQYTV